METYIFVVGDSLGINDKNVSSDYIATYRLEKRAWPLYRHTRNRAAIKTGDEVIIYLAGRMHGSQSFIASAVIDDICNDVSSCRDNEKLLSEPPYQCLKLRKIKYYHYVSVRPFLDKLSFVKDKSRWGMYFQGGTRKISKHDRDLIFHSLTVNV